MNIEELRTAVWRNFKREMEGRLAELRRMNDNAALDPEQTALIRGQIKEVKRILSLDASESPEVDPG